ncbi:glycosyltransferase [Humibacillus xanthopallidus]|uniref:glycosyltransferase n=1 Tax=Humibacillus xanthopallidus TaxID=412689 RepID=UPI00384FA7BA
MERATMSAGATRVALDDVRNAPSLLAGMRAIEGLSDAAAAEPETAETVRVLLAAILDPTDQLAAIGAVLALGGVRHERSGSALITVLREGPSYLRDHATWALGGCEMLPNALPLLVSAVIEGDFRGMLAQRTLESWALRHPDDVRVMVARGLATTTVTAARSRLVETLGLVPGDATQSLLRAVALGDLEDQTTRATAIAALGDPPPTRERREQGFTPSASTLSVLTMLAAQPGALSPVAQLALDDLRAVAEPRSTTRPEGDRTVAQLFLHADIDGALTHAGRGDTGGIATLLVHLGDALLRAEPSVCRVLTLSRGRSAAALTALANVEEPGHHYLSVPLWGQSPQAARAWPLWVAARRGIRRALRVAGQVDALHLRMADVGSLAAASAAHELGVPLVLTLAPDPHALVASREGSGELTRATIGDADEVEHLVFRDSLLRQLARRADHVVVFPRADLERDLRDLLGIDVDDEQLRLSVVPEGINLPALDAGLRHASPDAGRDTDTDSARGVEGTSAPEPSALGELDTLLDTLPAERRGLPLAISVGRLHPVKGMATLVQAWASRPDLSSRCNLLVVGGDLDEPNDDERGQLDLIGSVVPIGSAASTGLLLAGHRPNATVTTWLAATRHGRGDAAAARGIYVSASLKEEFGIAILEAMAAGLVVVAPGNGGPATYVTSGESGVLADTASVEALAAAVVAALDLAASPEADSTAERTMATVRDRFGIDTMATTLAGVYEQVATARHTAQAGGKAS